MGERKYIKFDRGPVDCTVRLRLVTADALLEYARLYSDNQWKNGETHYRQYVKMSVPGNIILKQWQRIARRYAVMQRA